MANSDLTPQAWGCDGIVTGATDTFDGQGNTSIIVSSNCPDTGAANSCNSYSVSSGGVTYDSWFLPAYDELINLASISSGLSNVTFNSGFYWSSSESNAAGSLRLRILPSLAGEIVSKSTSSNVRCVQAFSG